MPGDELKKLAQLVETGFQGLEAFVHTVKRDYINGADLRDAETVLAQLGSWIEDYNRQAPHSALGMRPPVEYRASLELTPPSV